MAKPYKNLREKMKPEHRRAAEEKAKKMLIEMSLQAAPGQAFDPGNLGQEP